MKDKPMVTIKLRGIDDWNEQDKRDVVNWIEAQARYVEEHIEEMANNAILRKYKPATKEDDDEDQD